MMRLRSSGDAQDRLGEKLQFTPTGLRQRKRDHVALETVHKEWVVLKSPSATDVNDSRRAARASHRLTCAR